MANFNEFFLGFLLNYLSLLKFIPATNYPNVGLTPVRFKVHSIQLYI